MVGGTLMAIMAGIYYWFPKIFGKMYNEGLARITFVLIFVGFNVTFFPQFILGAMGMPRRYYDYLPEYTSLNKISTFGAYAIALGFVIALYVIIDGVIRGKKASMNPWGAKTLEWTANSPPVHFNFDKEPTVTEGPYEYR
jgi:cytochrome c oxidase subunit I